MTHPQGDLGSDLLREAVRRVEPLAGEGELLVFVADEAMQYVEVSDSVCELLGYSREEFRSLHVTDIATDAAAGTAYQEMVRAGAAVGGATIRARDGRLYDLVYRASELPLAGRRLFVSVGTLGAGGNSGAETATGNRVRVVVADDHEPTRLLVRTLLDLDRGVEIVGEADNGSDAVELVLLLNPDVALLDIHMPQLDGLAAAETIRALRPATQVVLHTAQPDSELRRRATQLDVPLLDKMRFDEIASLLPHETGPSISGVQDSRIASAVLTALAATGGGTPVVVLLADGTVPFYSLAAAELLGLPLPPVASTLDEVRRNFRSLDLDGNLIPDDQRPITRAVTHRQPVDQVLMIERGGTRVRVRAVVRPFLDGDDFLGAAIHFHRL